jgi:uncharacterized protein YfkK (UPF0435 family)
LEKNQTLSSAKNFYNNFVSTNSQNFKNYFSQEMMMNTALNAFHLVTFLEQELRKVIEQIIQEKKNALNLGLFETQFFKIKKYYDRLTPIINFIFKFKEKFVGLDPLLLKTLALSAKFIRDAKYPEN